MRPLTGVLGQVERQGAVGPEEAEEALLEPGRESAACSSNADSVDGAKAIEASWDRRTGSSDGRSAFPSRGRSAETPSMRRSAWKKSNDHGARASAANSATRAAARPSVAATA